MEKRILAGKYALIKTKGSNGRISTYLVEDPLGGGRVMVKVFADEDPLALEYIKGMNLLGDHGCRGMLMPLEGGMLEDEPGYYLAFPEVPGQTLEEYLMLNPSLEEEELQRLIREVEAALHDLHAAGFHHLFLCPRNIFYSPGRPIYIKDMSLSYTLYSFLLQELQGFDYSYFSPRLMDGGEGRPEEDFYSLGRIVREILEKVDWAGDEDARQAIAKRAGMLMAADDAGSGLDEELHLEAPPVQCAAACGSSPAIEEEDVAGHVFRESGPPYVGTKVETGKDTVDKENEPGHPTDPFEALRAKLEGRSLDAGEGQHRDAAGAAGPRRGKRHLLGAMFALAALCAVLLLAYGLPTMSESQRPREDQERKVALLEEAGAAAGSAGEESEASPDVSVEGSALPETSSIPDDKEQAISAGEQVSLPDGSTGGAAPAAGETSAANRQPVASFSASPSEGSSPLQVYLDAGASYDPDGSIVSYSWSCGGSGVTVYRMFESNVIPTRIGVTLTVTDDDGASSSTTHSITLY